MARLLVLAFVMKKGTSHANQGVFGNFALNGCVLKGIRRSALQERMAAIFSGCCEFHRMTMKGLAFIERCD